MIFERITVEGLKGLKSVTMKDLSDVNIVVGNNGSGKTSLLESIFLSAGMGNPRSLMVLNQARNLGWGKGTQQQFVDGQIGNWFNKETSEGKLKVTAISRTEKRNEPKKREVTIEKEDQEGEITFEHTDKGNIRKVYKTAKGSGRRGGIFGQEEKQQRAGHEVVPVRFRYQQQNREPVDWIVEIGPERGTIRAIGHVPKDKLEAKLLGAHKSINMDDVYEYGRLRASYDNEELVKGIRHIVPEVRDIEMNILGTQPGLWADIGLTEMIPFAEMGGGASVIGAILLGIQEVEEGLLLIDEMENGVYFGNLKGLWESTYEALEKKRKRGGKVQLIATTHSKECYEAAVQAVAGRTTSLSMYRMQGGRGEGERKMVRISQEQAVAADSLGTDVR